MTAIISPCGKYRHKLSRHVSDDLPHNNLLFIMLNPSTADASLDDPTIRKCRGFAERFGFSFIDVVNLFDYRATDPRELRKVPVPSSPRNLDVILETASSCEMVICAWGTNGSYKAQNDVVLRMLSGVPLKALGVTKHGHPRHPLYVPYTAVPMPFPSLLKSSGG